MNRPLFRPEAVEYHARGRGAEEVDLDLRATRLTWSFRVLGLLLVVAVLVVLGVRVDETTRGETSVDGRSARVLAPVGALSRLRPGQAVRYGGTSGHVTDIGAPEVEGRVARVPVTVVFDGAPENGGEAVIVLGRRSLFDVIRRRDNG